LSYADLVPGTGCKEPASVLAKLGHGSPAGVQRLFSPGGTTMPTEVDYSHQGLVKMQRTGKRSGETRAWIACGDAAAVFAGRHDNADGSRL